MQQPGVPESALRAPRCQLHLHAGLPHSFFSNSAPPTPALSALVVPTFGVAMPLPVVPADSLRCPPPASLPLPSAPAAGVQGSTLLTALPTDCPRIPCLCPCCLGCREVPAGAGPQQAAAAPLCRAIRGAGPQLCCRGGRRRRGRRRGGSGRGVRGRAGLPFPAFSLLQPDCAGGSACSGDASLLRTHDCFWEAQATFTAQANNPCPEVLLVTQ